MAIPSTKASEQITIYQVRRVQPRDPTPKTTMASHHSQPNRRQFLGHLGLVAAATTSGVPVPPLHAESVADWDMSWVDEVAKAKYKAVFDSPTLADGAAPDLATGIWNNF